MTGHCVFFCKGQHVWLASLLPTVVTGGISYSYLRCFIKSQWQHSVVTFPTLDPKRLTAGTHRRRKCHKATVCQISHEQQGCSHNKHVSLHWSAGNFALLLFSNHTQSFFFFLIMGYEFIMSGFYRGNYRRTVGSRTGKSKGLGCIFNDFSFISYSITFI